MVNGKPAIEWIIERYSGDPRQGQRIVNDPNDWCREHNAAAIYRGSDQRVVRVSMETMKIVEGVAGVE